MQMELMIGAEQTGTLKLGEIPDVTDEQIAAMNFGQGSGCRQRGQLYPL